VARVCDHLVLLSAAHVQLAGDVSALLAGHSRGDGDRVVAEPDGRPVDLEDLVLAYMAGEVVR
jgi:ABC-2 type transport system ATP-binding protein